MNKILCICTSILGNKTFTQNLKLALGSLIEFDVTFIDIIPNDYKSNIAPKYRKFLGMSSESLWVINEKVKNTNITEYSLIIVQGFEIGWALNQFVANLPCIMFNDSTPTATHRMICKYPYHNFIWKLRSYILISSYKTFFRNIVSNIDIFFPRSNWCGQSLIEDFGVDSSKVNGGTVCFDLDTWSADWTLDREKNPTLLFVGNDFQRKGGNFLLKLFLELTDKITLKIISNDPCLDSQKLPQRVKHLKNISRKKILKHYQQDNIFIFPTYKEHLGLSQIEALAAGLPLISRDVGGVSDAVINGHNGFLIPYESTDQEWIEKIQYLIDHPEERERMGKNSRKLAEKKFSIENFKKTIHDTILKLLEEYALK